VVPQPARYCHPRRRRQRLTLAHRIQEYNK
jgi:hypothetical protein